MLLHAGKSSPNGSYTSQQTSPYSTMSGPLLSFDQMMFVAFIVLINSEKRQY